MNDNQRPKNYLDILSGECNMLADRFRLTSEQSEVLRKFVCEISMKSWRNGRAFGYSFAQNETAPKSVSSAHQ